MRRCKIQPPVCRHFRAAPCCKNCSEPDCPNRCQNTTERCNCWEDKPPRKRRERKVDSLQVAWLYGQGLTQVKIAEWLGCDRKTVGAILHEMGVNRFE